MPKIKESLIDLGISAAVSFAANLGFLMVERTLPFREQVLSHIAEIFHQTPNTIENISAAGIMVLTFLTCFRMLHLERQKISEETENQIVLPDKYKDDP